MILLMGFKPNAHYLGQDMLLNVNGNLYPLIMAINSDGDVMVSVLASSAVDRG